MACLARWGIPRENKFWIVLVELLSQDVVCSDLVGPSWHLRGLLLCQMGLKIWESFGGCHPCLRMLCPGALCLLGSGGRVLQALDGLLLGLKSVSLGYLWWELCQVLWMLQASLVSLQWIGTFEWGTLVYKVCMLLVEFCWLEDPICMGNVLLRCGCDVTDAGGEVRQWMLLEIMDWDMAVIMVFNCMVDTQKITYGTIKVHINFWWESLFKGFFCNCWFAEVDEVIYVRSEIDRRFTSDEMSNE